MVTFNIACIYLNNLYHSTDNNVASYCICIANANTAKLIKTISCAVLLGNGSMIREPNLYLVVKKKKP